jgi:hypothetical protein
MLYCLSHVSSAFCSGYFGATVSLFAQLAWTPFSYFTLPILAGMTGVYYHAQLFFH